MSERLSAEYLDNLEHTWLAEFFKPDPSLRARQAVRG